MGFLELLDSMKGKALDLTNIEIIKHTYQLQEQNNDQLRNLIAAYKDTITLKEKEIERLQDELQKFQSTIEDLRVENQKLITSEKNPSKIKVISFEDIQLANEDERVLKTQIHPGTHGHYIFKIAELAGLTKAKAMYCAEKLASLGLTYIKDGQMGLTSFGREFLVYKKMI